MGAYGNTSEASKVDPADLARLGVNAFTSYPPPVFGPTGAKWRLDYEYPSNWHNTKDCSGCTSYFWENLVPGSYTIEFSDVTGYTTPFDRYVILYDGDDTSTYGTYN